MTLDEKIELLEKHGFSIKFIGSDIHITKLLDNSQNFSLIGPVLESKSLLQEVIDRFKVTET